MTASTDTTPPAALLADRYTALAAGLGAVLDSTPAAAFTNPSPCAGWTGHDVVAHIIDTQRDFFETHGVEIGERPDLTDPAAAWHVHAAAVTGALADPAVAQQKFDGHFGPTTVGDTLLRFYGFDMIAHRWDVAATAGTEHRFTDDELEQLETAADGFGEALYSEGVCVRVETPPDADRQARILARLGRRAG